MQYVGYYRRMLATCLDLVLFSAVIYFFNYVSHLIFHGETMEKVDILALASGFYLLTTPLFEATPFQATPGKVLFGLKVVSKKGKRLNIFHSLLRSVVFYLSTAAFKITVWINLFSSDGKLLHDRLSASWVIKR